MEITSQSQCSSNVARVPPKCCMEGREMREGGVGDLGAIAIEVTSRSWSGRDPHRLLDCPGGVAALLGPVLPASVAGFRRPSQLPSPAFGCLCLSYEGQLANAWVKARHGAEKNNCLHVEEQQHNYIQLMNEFTQHQSQGNRKGNDEGTRISLHHSFILLWSTNAFLPSIRRYYSEFDCPNPSPVPSL